MARSAGLTGEEARLHAALLGADNDDDDNQLLAKYLQNDQVKQDEEGPDFEILAPGQPPASMFAPELLRNPMELGASQGPSLRVSQLAAVQAPPPEFVEGIDMRDLRASQVQRKIQTFQQLMDRNQLTHSQQMTCNIYLGNFGELISKLEILINRYIDEPEKLGSLLELHDSITQVLQRYDMHRAQRPDGREWPVGGGWTEDHDDAPPQPPRGPATDMDEETDRLIRQLIAQDQRQMGYGAFPPPPEPEPEEEENHEGQEQLECPICMDDFWFPSRHGVEMPCCNTRYCAACMQQNYEVLINDGGVLSLKCANPECNHPLAEDQVRALVNEDTFRRYQQFYLLACLRKDPTVRWCPKIGCETPIQGGNEENVRLTCPTCRTEVCWLCNLEWHEGMSCKRAEKLVEKRKGTRAQYDKKAEKFIKKNSRPCPNCKSPIQKNSGCNHMTCQHCRYEFCWVCMGHFEGYSHFDKGKCKGMQNWSSKTVKYSAYAGIGLGIGVGAVLAIGIGLPVAVVAGPPAAVAYGAYKIMKK